MSFLSEAHLNESGSEKRRNRGMYSSKDTLAVSHHDEVVRLDRGKLYVGDNLVDRMDRMHSRKKKSLLMWNMQSTGAHCSVIPRAQETPAPDGHS